MTKKLKLPDHFNPHAIVAWVYVGDTIKNCGNKAAVDYEFMRFMHDLHNAYPEEYEFYLAVLRNEV